MTKFKKHKGQLFRMLEEPELLTTDAKLPCLVRLIQDDSRMGMFNRDTKPSRLSDVYLAARIVSNNIVVDEFMESDYNRFEIIGYPVADGSKEWALYQMVQGETVTFLDYPNRTLKLVNGYIQDSLSDGFWNRKSGNEFLSYAYSTGWQIYKEPELKYKIGDWVECVAKQGQRKLVDYLGGMGCYKTNYGEVISPGEILRKLSPSEVIVHIGCMSGTIKDLSYAEDGRFWFIGEKTERCPGGMHCILYLEMLDTPTRELVESLLKVQEEKQSD